MENKFLKPNKPTIFSKLKSGFYKVVIIKKSALLKRYTAHLLPKKYKVFDNSITLQEIKQGSKELKQPLTINIVSHYLAVWSANKNHYTTLLQNNFNNELPF